MAKKKSKMSGRVWVEEKHPRGKGGKFASKGIPKISELHKDALHKAMAAKGLTVKKRTFSTAHTMDLSKFHQGKLSLKELEELATKLNLEHPIKYRNRKASWNDVITKHLSASGIKVPVMTASKVKKEKPKESAKTDHKAALLEQAAEIKRQVGSLDKPGSYAKHDGDADRVAAFAHLAKAGFTKYNTEDEAISLMKGSTHWAQSSPDRSKHAKLKHHELAAAGIANGHIVTFGMLSPDKKKEAAMQLAATGNPYHRTADKELHVLGEQMAKLAGTKGHSAMGKAVLKQTASYQHVETVKAKELDRRRSALAQLIGEEKVKKLEDSFNQATKDTRTHVRIPTDAVLNKIIKSGGLKTAHEVGLDSSYLDLRDNVEHKLFGIKKGQIEGRPLYGYQAPHGDYGGDAHAGAQMYGGLILRLKPDVENRTTVALGDTFTGVVPTVKGKFNAGALLHPEAMSESTGKVRSDMETVAKGRIRDYEQNSKHINDLAERYSYVESQVHGGINLSDIESVVVPPDAHAKGINVSDETRELLKKHGIAIEEHKPPKGVRRAPSSISKAAKAKADKASKLLDDILDGLV